MRNNLIGKFISEHSNFFNGNSIVRGIYLRMDCTELFILECSEWKNKRTTFVFEFDCGYFCSCKTEINTMEKYLMDISKYEHAEYVLL